MTDDEITEPNLYRQALHDAAAEVESRGAAVHVPPGSPLDAVARPLADGGWVCAEADDWIVELREQCSGILEAFDDAAARLTTLGDDQPERVPQHDQHGYAWSRTQVKPGLR